MATMPVYVIAHSYMHAVEIARRGGVESSKGMVWLTSTNMIKIRGIDEPHVWVCACCDPLEALTRADLAMIESRRAHFSKITL